MSIAKVVGIDVCCNKVVACHLSELPSNPHEFYQEHEFQEYPLNRSGVEALIATKPEVCIYEPTGIAYSRVWVERLKEAGVLCKAVDHAKLRAYRKGLGLPDKDDYADSLALACYYLDPLKQSKFAFIRSKDPAAAEIRRLVLRLQHIDRRKSPIANRLKQDLAIAFPEKMKTDCDGAPLFWGWLAGERISQRYDRELSESIGLGIYPELQQEAKALTHIFREEKAIEVQISYLINSNRQFDPYVKVLREFGFGLRTEALLLSQIYPLTDFLTDGQPEVKIRKGRNSGKPTARHLSLRRFQKAIGCAPVREESGDSKRRQRGGSALCRKALWQWCFTRIETKSKTSNSRILEIRSIYQFALNRFSSADLNVPGNKAKGVKVRLARAYVRRKVSILLFKALVEAIVPTT